MEQVELQNNQIIAPLARPEGVARGKFRSLTLINWNGFFCTYF